jgi:hypothetical protein
LYSSFDDCHTLNMADDAGIEPARRFRVLPVSNRLLYRSANHPCQIKLLKNIHVRVAGEAVARLTL